MKRTELYWVDGEFMTSRKARRIKKREGFNFETAIRKSVYKKTLNERLCESLSKIVPVIEFVCVVGIVILSFYFALFY